MVLQANFEEALYRSVPVRPFLVLLAFLFTIEPGISVLHPTLVARTTFFAHLGGQSSANTSKLRWGVEARPRIDGSVHIQTPNSGIPFL